MQFLINHIHGLFNDINSTTGNIKESYMSVYTQDLRQVKIYVCVRFTKLIANFRKLKSTFYQNA